MATHSSILAWKIPWTEEVCSNILAWKIPWQRSLAGYSPWDCKKSDKIEHTHMLARRLAGQAPGTANYLSALPVLPLLNTGKKKNESQTFV